MRIRAFAAGLLLTTTATVLTACGDTDTGTKEAEASKAPSKSAAAKNADASPSPSASSGKLTIGQPYKWTAEETEENAETSGTSNVIGYEQPVVVKNWSADAIDVEKPEWIAVEVKVCNDRGDDISVSQTPWTLGFPDDTTVETKGLIGSGLPQPEYPVEGGTLRPGDCLRGKIPFVVEKGQRPDRVIYQGSDITRVEWAVPPK
ncbi:DUF4352 domain-containing protein [Streptomyces pristinaespiralis]|uniref:DUF4352 domain-containing protein n=1 Tax=Streptomyces pristinaespiralis TaxID=38300 RepID=UPI00379C67D0